MLSARFLRYLHKTSILTLRYSSTSVLCVTKTPYSSINYTSINLFKTINTHILKRTCTIDSNDKINSFKFEEVCDETLDSLCDYFEELIEQSPHLKGADVLFGDGVLTVQFGEPYGTYVINRQSPNKQIWLSSPTSGPKRYDFSTKSDGCWIYKHDGVTLHQLLQDEINKIVKDKADFSKCLYSLV